MSLWLLHVFVDGILHEIRVIWVINGLLNHGKTGWKLPHLLFADDAVQLPELEEELDRMEGCLDNVYRRRMLKVNMSKSETLVFERNVRSVCLVKNWNLWVNSDVWK